MAHTHVICGRPLSPKTSQQHRNTSMSHSSLSDFSKDMFLIKGGMNTHKKQKHKQKYLKAILVMIKKMKNKTEPLLGKKSSDEVGQKDPCPDFKG